MLLARGKVDTTRAWRRYVEKSLNWFGFRRLSRRALWVIDTRGEQGSQSSGELHHTGRGHTLPPFSLTATASLKIGGRVDGIVDERGITFADEIARVSPADNPRGERIPFAEGNVGRRLIEWNRLGPSFRQEQSPDAVAELVFGPDEKAVKPDTVYTARRGFPYNPDA
jgi:hypothetical protein